MSLSQCRLAGAGRRALAVITRQKKMHGTLSMSHASASPKMDSHCTTLREGFLYFYCSTFFFQLSLIIEEIDLTIYGFEMVLYK